MSKKEIREIFRQAVFTRDNHKCVVPHCNNPVADAHHIIERALWKEDTEFGGYIPDNGVSVCELHHKHAEANFIPPQALRQWAGIKNRVLPAQFDASKIYDKWGTPLIPPNRELVKYPHTRYLTFTPGFDKLDVDECGYMEITNMYNKPLVITMKMDGSNVKLTSEIVTARNGHSAGHKSFDFLKSKHASFKHLIPPHINVFAEWLYAKHSIHYTNDLALDDILLVFAVYDGITQLWGGWEDVQRVAASLNLKTVPVLTLISFPSNWECEPKITKIGNDVIKKGHEGIVIRSLYPYHWSKFGENVAKYVRANHVTSSKHWKEMEIVKNEVKT